VVWSLACHDSLVQSVDILWKFCLKKLLWKTLSWKVFQNLFSYP
jgi:hypothetical protein